MDSFKDYYMDPDFDPRKVTIPRLREIFLLNGVHYTGNERKADLVSMFEDHIRPRIPELRREEKELKQKAEQHRSAEKRRRHSRTKSLDVPKTPETQKSTGKRGTGRGKQKNKGKVMSVEEENIPDTPTPIFSDQNFEPLVPDDDEQMPVAEVSTNDRDANRNQRDKKRDVSPDERAKGQTYSVRNVSFTEVPKLYPEVSKSPNEEEHQPVRREAIAYAYRNPNRIPRSQISRILPPDVDFSALEPSSSKGWLFIFTILLFLTGAVFMMIRIRVEIGFCDSGDSLNNTLSNVFDIPEDDKNFIESNCAPCPPHGHCSDGRLVSCDEGYAVSSSSLDFLRTFTSRCVVDLNRVQKIEKYTRLLKDVVAVETGRMKCGAGGSELVLFESLKGNLRAKKLPSHDSEVDFEKYTLLALERLRTDEDVEISTEEIDSEDRMYIISKKPKIDIFCRMKKNGIDFLRENSKIIISMFSPDGFLHQTKKVGSVPGS
ncbi:11176_t:CDS:2, partial [Acaulospora morrowiae]